MKIDRMLINASLETLARADEEWIGAARLVIAYGVGLRESGKIVLETSVSDRGSNHPVSGFAAGVGNVELRDKSSEKTKEFSYGMFPERIGQFRLFKESKGLLMFSRYWKYSLGTRDPDDEPEKFYIGFDPKTQEPKFLGVLTYRELLPFRSFRVRLCGMKILRGSSDVSHFGFSLLVCL